MLESFHLVDQGELLWLHRQCVRCKLVDVYKRQAHEAEILKDHKTPDVEGLDEAQAREVLKQDYEERRKIMDANPIHVAIAGRMMFKRVMGKASFCNIQDLQGNIQVYVARDAIGEESYCLLYTSRCV